MIYLGRPDDFNPSFDAVGCFCKYGGKFLLLQRQENKHKGNLWGAPSGKILPGETARAAVARELLEETGTRIRPETFKHFRKFYVRYPNEFDFTYDIFSAQYNRSVVQLNPEEHKAYQWVKPAEALKMDTVPDMDACVKMFYRML